MRTSKKIIFTKMHGLGNDFIVLDDLHKTTVLKTAMTAELARWLCDRHFGIGADQILWLKKPQNKKAAARMEIWNADGSTATMCGNGIRASALYLVDHHRKALRGRPRFAIETEAGIVPVQVCSRGGVSGQKNAVCKEAEVLRTVRVALAVPKLGRGFDLSNLPCSVGEEISILGKTLRFFEVNVGNEHAVFFADRVGSVFLELFGPAIEAHAAFPGRTNVEFVEVLNDHELQVRVWERGAGITLACGSGATAVAAAAMALGRVRSPCTVRLPGGSLQMRWGKGDGEGGVPLTEHLLMEGPAVEVFVGEFSV